MCSEQDQIKSILNQYKKAGYLDEATANGMLDLKKRIELSKETTVSSARIFIKMLNDRLDERDIELRNEEEEIITKFESLVRGYLDSHVLNDNQLAAYKDVWYIHDKYSNKK